MDSSQKIICPIITCWVLLALNCFLFYFQLIINIDYRYEIFDSFSSYEWFVFFSLLINFLLEVIASILVTISFENKKFRLYFIGLIMSLVFDIYITVYIFVGEDVFYYIRRRGIFNAILIALIEWTFFVVLMIYYKRVKALFNKSYINSNLINDNQTPENSGINI